MAGSDPSSESDPNINPLSSKAMNNTEEPIRKNRPKNPVSRYSPPPLKSVTTKRKNPDTEPVSKKSMFQRLWSENDEIQLLNGMISYIEINGKYPMTDVTSFHEFVKGSLNIDVNNAQIIAKIKRLKAKFKNNVGRTEANGNAGLMLNEHEMVMYDLSLKLWGGDGNKYKKAGNAKREAIGKGKNGNLDGLKEGDVSVVEVAKNLVNLSGGSGRFGVIGLEVTDEEIMKKGSELVSGTKKLKLEKKWNDFKVQELKLFLKKLELLKEHTEIVLNAVKMSGVS
nr:GLABROUS1 enhancer-binding protein-like [Tanacetum cinerariifolium]